MNGRSPIGLREDELDLMHRHFGPTVWYSARDLLSFEHATATSATLYVLRPSPDGAWYVTGTLDAAQDLDAQPGTRVKTYRVRHGLRTAHVLLLDDTNAFAAD
ncbi:hypothetical protein [Deinococcus maricopensis]|uniref:Uncharacterized protein n=1 Tax=Deinococcus maricopensis (strain DSM 21211 / LMG 22137 / NRRL B-23946 / LB-34) TaxID=709986 RepID=E8U7I8_DEIML|nr:hypothetical protein [Deinococcus maricopensis]ADV67027.1 hypothetical protein Deima_1377 [Deinococcus maricopensis DSM 21211]